MCLAAVPILAAIGLAYAVQPFSLGFGAAEATAAPAPATIPFTVCFDNPSWRPPNADSEGAHLEADPRYRGIDLKAVKPERVHVELGPFRSNSALGDFVALSGLWADPSWRSMTCSANLQGKVELWVLALHVERMDAQAGDLRAILKPQPSGVEIVQVALPASAEALHFTDPAGAKLAADLALRSQ